MRGASIVGFGVSTSFLPKEGKANTLKLDSLFTSMENPSVFLSGPFQARIEERPVPVINDANDVIIRIAYTGVCGSDVCIAPKDEPLST